ncbi:MAG: NAD(+) diphosphatase [Solirubrobacteraceae bacterium]
MDAADTAYTSGTSTWTVFAPPLTGATIDRAAGLRTEAATVRELIDHPAAVVVGASADSVLVTDGPNPQLLRRPLDGRVNPYQPILLGLEHGRPVFGADLDSLEAEGEVAQTGIGRLMSLRQAGALLERSESGLAAYLVALLNWHRTHRFCERCGSATRITQAGLVRRCSNCNSSHYPRTDPVVIMLVEHDGHLLLGRRLDWTEARYSILAGHVANGETPEEAVLREVHEESGIIAHSPRYVASQPWPFPSSLMLGYEASSDGGEPTPQPGEMRDVRWFSLAEVINAQRGEGEFFLPGEVSIARALIDAWVARGGRRLPSAG